MEPGALVFHPENIFLGTDVYVGHNAILKGYHKNRLDIGDGSWIGQQAFLHSAGGLRVGSHVGIGPGVRIITSSHEEAGRGTPVLHAPLVFREVVIHDDVDLGISSTVLPGVTIGQGAVIGAGAVVARDIPAYVVAAGVPARVIRERPP